MLVLARDDRSIALRVLALRLTLRVRELGTLLGQTALHASVIVMLEMALLSLARDVVVLLGERLLVLDGLHRGVVVVLVHLTVNGFVGLVVLGAGDVLLRDGRGDFFVHACVVLARGGPGVC